jgi:hypothetical protein
MQRYSQIPVRCAVIFNKLFTDFRTSDTEISMSGIEFNKLFSDSATLFEKNATLFPNSGTLRSDFQ